MSSSGNQPIIKIHSFVFPALLERTPSGFKIKKHDMADKKPSLFMRFLKNLMVLTVLLVILCGTAWSHEEAPIILPKVEGSKSFDLKIDQINNQSIQFYHQGNFEKAIEHFGRALNLAEHLRDPSQGILYFNLALSLHKSGRHEEAAQRFFSARRFARGNPAILKSELLEMYECRLNPSEACEKKFPLEMKFDESH